MGAIQTPMYGEAFGPDLVVNGGFSSSSDWTLPSTWAISGGTANYTPGASGPMYQIFFPSVSEYNATSRLTFDITSGIGSVYVVLVGDVIAFGATRAGVGTYTEDLYLPGYYTTIRVHTESADAVSIDNISLVRIY